MSRFVSKKMSKWQKSSMFDRSFGYLSNAPKCAVLINIKVMTHLVIRSKSVINLSCPSWLMEKSCVKILMLSEFFGWKMLAKYLLLWDFEFQHVVVKIAYIWCNDQHNDVILFFFSMKIEVVPLHHSDGVRLLLPLYYVVEIKCERRAMIIAVLLHDRGFSNICWHLKTLCPNHSEFVPVRPCFTCYHFTVHYICTSIHLEEGWDQT